MTLNLELVTLISRQVARNLDERIDVVSVASTDGGSERVELLLTLANCHQEPCVIMVNVPRSDISSLERELRQKLHEALTAHRAA